MNKNFQLKKTTVVVSTEYLIITYLYQNLLKPERKHSYEENKNQVIVSLLKKWIYLLLRRNCRIFTDKDRLDLCLTASMKVKRENEKKLRRTQSLYNMK